MQRDRRLASILEAAATVLAEGGAAACSMREVARRAGLSAATLYRYVQGREELLYLVQERILERAIRSAEAARALRGPQLQLRSFVTDHIRRMSASPAESRLLERGAEELPPPLARRIGARRKTYEDLACDLVQGACGTPPRRRNTTRLHVHMLLGMAERVAREASRNDPPTAPHLLARRVIDLFLHGAR